MTALPAAAAPATGRRSRTVLALACVAVAFAAADTYVVVLALPDMMTGVGLGIEELQRAAPIVSGFLLGYVAMLPLLGRIADLRGRMPVLVGSLLVFAVGSLVTAAAYDLTSVVAGRFLQGVGGGGLVPATLALVADLWPPHRRGLPLGMVGGVQELGSVLGPLYGALVLAAFDWRAIFWLNLVAGLGLAIALRLAARDGRRPLATYRRPVDAFPGAEPCESSHPPRKAGDRPAYDVLGATLALAAILGLALLLLAPTRLTSHVTVGLAWVPLAGDSRWTTPLAVTVGSLLALFVSRELTAARPLIDLRSVRGLARSADLLGAVLLGLALAGVVLAFATADPQVQVLSPAGPWLLTASGLCAVAFWVRQRSTDHPLVPRGALTGSPAWGSLLVGFFVGAALIAALVDIPVYARVTVHPESQLGAALVLLRFLVALPIGALAGGWLLRRLSPGPLTALGMAVAAVGFAVMATWDAGSLHGPAATVVLLLTGFGFGLAIAPVNAALLASTASSVHGVASALLVVARMVGMLVGISALTAIGLRRFYTVAATVPSPEMLCPAGESPCRAYLDALRGAGLAQIHAVFVGAAVCAAVAAALAAVLYRRLPAAGAPSPDLLRVAG